MLNRLYFILWCSLAGHALAFSVEGVSNKPAYIEGSTAYSANPPAQLAILIDDMGHSLRSNKAALALPGAVSFAFLPFATHSIQMANMAKKLGRDVLLHAPMENIHNIPLGPGGMTSKMSESSFKRVLNQDIDAIPHVIGVNNHMGSELTALSVQMRWTMEVLAERGLFFVDSKTTPKSVAWRQAKKVGMAGVKRDVFLDHELNIKAIHQQFLAVIKRAKSQGFAVLIAHPHSLSIRYLERNLAKLAQNNVELVKLSSIVEQALKKSQLSMRHKEYLE